jgi:hypothetical protein
MYSKEYKNWIASEHETPPIVETIDSFKEYWAAAISLVNQTSIPAAHHGYGMAAMDDDTSIALYGELLASFGAAYAATQESMKSQATTMAAMQGQLANIQQFCMAVNQQPPPTIYAPPQQQQQQNTRRNNRRNGGSGGANGTGSFPQQPTWFGVNGAGAQQPTRPPTPYKRWENWNYCSTHGGDVDDSHTSMTCGNRGPTHNQNATRANIMGGSIAGMHKSILPSACGRTPPTPRRPQQQQQRPQQLPPVSYYPMQGMMQQQPGRVRATMPMPAQMPMMNFVGQQYPPNTVQIMQQPAQQAMPMMAPYYAPNQQPTAAPNQQQQNWGYF